MRYSLRSRVRGIFLGMLLGETLTNQESVSLGEIAVSGSQSLIKWGRLEIEEWWENYQNTTSTAGIIVIAALPLAIFYHEDPDKFKQNLQQFLKLGNADPEERDNALAWGYVLIKCLTETLNTVTLIPETIDFLGNTTSPLPESLLKLNNLLKQQAGIVRVGAEFNLQENISHNMALSLYCFLSSVEDFKLSLLRSNKQAQIFNCYCSMLTGVMSGAYNSVQGIPVNWKILLSLKPGMDNLSEIEELTDNLVRLWSGAYNVNIQLAPHSIFAAPHLIRPR
ncbi:hypothetical protein CEP10_07420 [Cylindrospermopsis raciborskii S07]|uniref:ADP-ribosylation/Crystallin J1 n=4 Tax=Cylindrospermopsis raciborskii TaxID=77022 RepID=A0A853MDZ0_9CYAN|nr:ADP-ribosylglycohydrolase family protein [Cylindrospermopsis raciborskii]PNJ97977.1 hypothetical protein CEP13_02015 [Cylindrospermopsis raciborskii C03]PNJ99497.1 hypothetical protein CEP14_00605 [Cylindrospermopsis raciborskii C04]PNK00445.1 hypothetical protein CEP15_03920 [Cylindrospermopsis raciborskii C07]PNK01413.1 hypothetical protein CEP11_17920 [Cylindrospermopsis raciborskii S10]PNK08462.1 hypothetical protein CEP10_07420 [Cylindrospermopsis raciborskii S07]PNK09131.1 hypothetic